MSDQGYAGQEVELNPMAVRWNRGNDVVLAIAMFEADFFQEGAGVCFDW